MVDQVTLEFEQSASASASESEPDPEQVKVFITDWISKIDAAKEHWKDDFSKMDESILLANGVHWDNQTKKDDRYIADVIKRVVQRRVAALYAKNPTIIARRRPRLDFALWDGKSDSLQSALANPLDPFNAELLADIAQGMERRRTLDKVGKTQQIVFHQQLKQQQPTFKRQMKHLVRRVETTGVGYLRLDFHREMELKPDIQQNIEDLATQISRLEQTAASYAESGQDSDVTAERLRIQMRTLQERRYALIREGLLLSFPRSKSIIIDPCCYQLDGFLGARWLAEEFYMSADEIERVTGVDIKGGSLYEQQRVGTGSSGQEAAAELHKWTEKKDKKGTGYYCVYLVHDKDTHSVFMIARGGEEYLQAPAAPKFMLERFFPYYALSFNETENDKTIYPESTVYCLRHPQREFNRSKEALRQHRIASKPLYVSATGALSEEDKTSMDQHAPHDVIELSSLNEGQSVDTLLQQVKKHPIDPNVYNSNDPLKDMYLVAGSQPADLSQTSGATATETSLAEDSRVSDLASNADDLDDFLNAFVEDAGKVMLLEFSAETIRRIAGPGAVWPEFTAQDIADDLYLEIEAGSSGRPNKAAEGAALRSNMPFVLQIPGANPEFWLRKLVENTFDNIDPEDAILDGIPSILAMNAQKQLGTGDPATDPNAQGVEGATTDPAARAEPVSGLGVGGFPDIPMPPATARAPAPQRTGGLLSRLRGG